MKSRINTLILVVLVLLLFVIKENSMASSLELRKSEAIDSCFSKVKDYPLIRDSAEFISDLLNFCEVELDSNNTFNGHISSYSKVKMAGSEDDYFMIEYDYFEGSGASYPWKYQFLFTSKGALVESMSALRYQWVKIFENEYPFLLTLTGTSKGNGWHNLYKISADSLVNVLDDNLEYYLRTYDTHEDNAINIPSEFRLVVVDYNNDGFKDISFEGKEVLLQKPIGDGIWIDGEVIDEKAVEYSVSNPFKELDMEFVFLFNNKNGHFEMKEDYNLKYQELR